MKLPTPALLYSLAIGLFGWSGWTVYGMVPLWKKEARDQAVARGQKAGMELLARGKGREVQESDWIYVKATQPWWEGLKRVNLIGKLPPPPPPPVTVEGAAQRRLEELDQRPLEEVIELVSLVHDSKESGKGGNSYVIVRYKPEANVEPPEWWLRENTAVASGPAGQRLPGDTVRTSTPRALNQAPTTAPVSGAKGGASGAPPRAGSQMPSSITGKDMLQKIWVQDDADPRRSSFLWPVKSQPATPGGKERALGKVRLVRVASDAQSAFFVREMPVVDPNAPALEPKEEELIKTTMNLSQEVLQETRRLQGKGGKPSRNAGVVAQRPSGTWLDVEETTRIGQTTHIGRADEKRFRQDADQMFGKLQVDTYISKSSSLRGLVVRNVEPELASRFGVVTGDVLIEINDRKVDSKEQAILYGRADYDKGVRSFVTKWLSNGQVVERTYQAPDR